MKRPLTENHETQPCRKCQGGRKHLSTVTLMTWLGDDLVTVPDFPAWICDLCGHHHYDNHALAELSLILNPEAGTPIHTSIGHAHKKPPVNISPPA